MKITLKHIVTGSAVALIGVVGFAGLASAGGMQSHCDDQGNTILEAAPSWATYTGSLRIVNADTGEVVFDGPGGSWTGQVNAAGSYEATWYDLANEWEGGVWGTAFENTPECEPIEVVVVDEPTTTEEVVIDLIEEEPVTSEEVVLDLVTEEQTTTTVVTVEVDEPIGSSTGQLPATGGRLTLAIVAAFVCIAGYVLRRIAKRPEPITIA